MINNNNVSTIEKALELLNIVTKTMGPQGRLVSIQKSDEIPKVTKDGVTVLDNIHHHNMGVEAVLKLIKEAARKTDKVVGDSTTTTTKIVQSILQKAISNDYFTTIDGFDSELSEYMLEATNALVEIIKQNAGTAITDEDIERVVLTSTNGDVEITKVVMEAIRAADFRSEIVLDTSDIDRTKTECFVEERGMFFDCTGHTHVPIVYENARFVLIHGHVRSMVLLEPLVREAAATKTKLVIMASDFDQSVIKDIKINRDRGELDCVLIQAEGFESNEYDITRAVADLLECTIYSVVRNNQEFIHNYKMEDLPIVDAEVNRYNSVIVPKHTNEVVRTQLIDKHVDTKKEHTSQAILAKVLPVVTIRIGANTSAKVSEIQDRVIDSLKAAESVNKYGFIRGGGHDLYIAARTLDNTLPGTGKRGQAKRIIVSAAQSIFQNLCTLANVKLNAVPTDTCQMYNFALRKYAEVEEEVVYDPANGVIEAFINAVEVAITILSISAHINNNVIEDECAVSLQ